MRQIVSADSSGGGRARFVPCSTLAAMVVIGLAGAAVAQSTSGVVVELFTSQGCAACPPADEFLGKLAQSKGVIALALHVDYWDYIGWADKFAQAGFTDRQKAYARAVGDRMIYTPQMVVGGHDRIEGLTPDQVVNAIGRAMDQPSPVDLTLTRQGDQVVINASSDAPLARPAMVQLVRYDPQATVAIGGGENQGQTVHYTNIVTSWQSLGDWPGHEALTLTAPAPGDQPVVVILQEAGPSRIIAAARLAE